MRVAKPRVARDISNWHHLFWLLLRPSRGQAGKERTSESETFAQRAGVLRRAGRENGEEGAGCGGPTFHSCAAAPAGAG